MTNFERFNQYRQKVYATVKSIALLVWSAPPIELLTAGIFIPGSIVAFCWLFQWVGPILTVFGYLVGVAYVLTAIAKLGYLWNIQRNNKRSEN